eukprot:TRINITY_DN11070_c0_g1_i2.p1 TRINITY_DN11070_c0_g1~~TRINITY_DN11070_c0_g1_i2.p1  ORF type:complete len:405 (-),score=92.21 TRINITY_DN11070_c0_g1_i2:101-1315(-)
MVLSSLWRADNLQKYDLPNPQAIFDIEYFKEHPSAFYLLAKEMWPGQYAPTPAHLFVRLLQDKGLLLRCYTQNIDSLEREAGLSADKIVAAHGNFDSATCIATQEKVPVDEVKEAVRVGPEACDALRTKYGGLVKPDIVFFGENLPEQFHRLVPQDFPEADLLLVIGTSLQVQPFAGLINNVAPTTPRMLLNLEAVGQGRPGFRFDCCDNYRDVLLQSKCDAGVSLLVEQLGWQSEFAELLAEYGVASGAEQLEEHLCKNWRKPPPELPEALGLDLLEEEECWTEVSPGCMARRSGQSQIDIKVGQTVQEFRFVTCKAGAWCLEQCHGEPQALEGGAVSTVSLDRAEEEGELHELWIVSGEIVVARLGPMSGTVTEKLDNMEQMMAQLRDMGISEDMLRARGLL